LDASSGPHGWWVQTYTTTRICFTKNLMVNGAIKASTNGLETQCTVLATCIVTV